jgi:flagellar biosynthesis/type III secretory pathway protein FliH
MKSKEWLKQKGIHPTEPIYWDTGEKNIYLDELMDEFVSSQLEPQVKPANGGQEDIYKKGYDAGFEKGLYEGQAKQAILELQGRDRFVATLREKIKKGEKI